MSKQQLATILEMTSRNHPPDNATPDMMRAWVEEATSHTPIADNVRIARVTCGPCDGDRIVPEGGDPSRLIIFYHGGGFFFCSSRTHRVTASNLARAAGCAHLATGTRGSPKVTPLYADFTGLPPSLVHVGSWEKLRDDSVTVVQRLKAAGVAADLKIFDGMCHTWQMFAPMLDEGMASIEECAAFIRAYQS